MIEGVPVQLLPAYNALVEAALAGARVTTTTAYQFASWAPNTWSRWRSRRAAPAGASGRGSSYNRVG